MRADEYSRALSRRGFRVRLLPYQAQLVIRRKINTGHYRQVMGLWVKTLLWLGDIAVNGNDANAER